MISEDAERAKGRSSAAKHGVSEVCKVQKQGILRTQIQRKVWLFLFCMSELAVKLFRVTAPSALSHSPSVQTMLASWSVSNHDPNFLLSHQLATRSKE